MFKKSLIYPIIFAAVLIGGVSTYLSYRPVGDMDIRSKITASLGPAGEYIIELGDDGFYPQEITIRRGDVVSFVATRDGYFWPASNFHPIHTIYPEFDPKEPIEPSGKWNFRFNKIGEWGYHDHLAPYFTGKIIVTETDSSISISRDANCKDKQNSKECWQEQLISILYTEGVGATFDLLGKLYKQETKFPISCHSLAHNIGIAAYKLYLDDKDSVLAPKAAYCANGFYHGFMEGLLTATRNLKEAKEFCARVDEKLTSRAPDAALQCYHGIGHGAMDLVLIDGLVTNNERSLIAPALEFCEKASEDAKQLYRCTSGVFNGLANFYTRKEFGLTVRKDDPFWICHEQPEKYKESCYGNMNSAIFWLADRDFSKSARFVENLIEDKYAIPAIQYLAGSATITLAKSNPEGAVRACRALQLRLYLPCIRGFSHGFLEHGTPGFEYKDALDFCRSKSMLIQERETCFTYVLSNLNGWYSKNKAKEICNAIEKKYKQYCN
ncbi:hypothetical protein IIA95_03080 [Patescibacteria group bacterium]|nr:hypothetical protein [Patescibacteria group bacterium]